MADGFTGIRVDVTATQSDSYLNNALDELRCGKSVVLYTALGPADRLDHAGGDALGERLGTLLRNLILRSGVRRIVVAGGDTSTHAIRKIGVTALTFAGLTVPGAPFCRTHSAETFVNGLELVLKGGQIGPEDYFERVRKASQI
jgi:uncharacterized protein YgbK (DUF1537 family)